VIVARRFGAGAELRLFGSRADPARRGGDADLRVLLHGPRPPREAELQAVVECERALGDLRVDLVVLAADEPPTAIDRAALASGVRL